MSETNLRKWNQSTWGTVVRRNMLAATQAAARMGWPLWFLLAFSALAVAGPLISPYNPLQFDMANALKPPSLAHPFGTDQFGRDLLSRMIVGSRSLVTVAGAATLLTLAIGTVWGLFAAYRSGIGDEILMRAADILMSLPPLVIAIVILVVLGSSDATLSITVAIVYAPFVSRVVRSAALVVMAQEYVDAARLAGEKTAYILVHEVLPNIFPILAIEAAMRFGFIVLLVASLGFLGMGVQPPTPDWGLLVNDARNYLGVAPWLVLFPGAAIASLVLSSHALADAVGASEQVRAKKAGLLKVK